MSEPVKSRRWIWFFAALVVLAVLAIGIRLVYFMDEPLTADKLQAARERWRQNRPADYDLLIHFSRQFRSVDGTGGTMRDKFEVRVRGRTVTEFLINGKEPEPLLDKDGKQNPGAERRQRESYDMDGFFDSIEELLEQDLRAGRRSFVRARFDTGDGHIMLFSRQFGGLREQYIKVEMTKVRP